jgi:hypothetical protein
VTDETVAASGRRFNPRSWQLPSRLLGIALLVGAANPMGGAHPVLGMVRAVLGVGLGWWAAPPLTVRPTASSSRPLHRLARHRNTVLATAAVLLATVSHPSAGLAAAVTALLLGYLLHVDVRSHARLPTRPGAALSACVAAAVVLAAALAPAQSSGAARLLAAFGIAAAAGAVGLALHQRRSRGDN